MFQQEVAIPVSATELDIIAVEITGFDVEGAARRGLVAHLLAPGGCRHSLAR